MVAQALALKSKHVLDLYPTAPFHFDATMHKPDHFPSADNAWQSGVRWQSMRWHGMPLGLKFENRGTVDRPHVSLIVWSEHELEPSFLDSLAAEITYRCNLHLDLAEFYAWFGNDPQLGPVIERWRGARPVTHASLYEYLIIAIVLQNATVRRSVQMMQALFEAYGTSLTCDGPELYCFWEPGALAEASEEELRQLKVGYRARSILRVTDAFAQQQIDEFALRQCNEREQRRALLGLYGIGPASVGYILFDVFHQWNELSHISPWEQRIYSRLFLDRDPEDPAPVDRLLQHLDTRFAGYRMLAVHYIWEDLFWKRTHEQIPWLEKLIRL